ncbi:MAG: DUF3151 domain-containing protein [Actinobacteria bacterium]|nr:DUF3151 domain-containing protein [Actinomycetota bacterium]
MSDVSIPRGLPETVLPPEPPDVTARLDAAASRQDAAPVVADHPRSLEGWARLGELSEADDPVAAYAFYRVGYHRGLDALRAAGWRGSGYVRWRNADNRGFLRALDGLRRVAASIGEADEAARCDEFLHQLDPNWERR